MYIKLERNLYLEIALLTFKFYLQIQLVYQKNLMIYT
jgi:hypothetical protein